MVGQLSKALSVHFCCYEMSAMRSRAGRTHFPSFPKRATASGHLLYSVCLSATVVPASSLLLVHVSICLRLLSLRVSLSPRHLKTGDVEFQAVWAYPSRRQLPAARGPNAQADAAPVSTAYGKALRLQSRGKRERGRGQRWRTEVAIRSIPTVATEMRRTRQETAVSTRSTCGSVPFPPTPPPPFLPAPHSHTRARSLSYALPPYVLHRPISSMHSSLCGWGTPLVHLQRP